MIPFSSRAALCTLLVVAGLATAVTAQSPGGLFDLIGMDRDGLLTIDGGGTPRENDQSEIVAAVLAHEARGRRDAVCVRLADEGEALASERAEIEQTQRAIAESDPPTRARLLVSLDHLRNPARSWLRPPAPGSVDAEPLGEENRRVLHSVETAVLGAPVSGRVDITLDMGALPEVLRSNAPDCPVLAFTAPAIVGDIALVESIHFCGPLCASGRLYALSRRVGGWRIEAWTDTWIT